METLSKHPGMKLWKLNPNWNISWSCMSDKGGSTNAEVIQEKCSTNAPWFGYCVSYKILFRLSLCLQGLNYVRRLKVLGLQPGEIWGAFYSCMWIPEGRMQRERSKALSEGPVTSPDEWAHMKMQEVPSEDQETLLVCFFFSLKKSTGMHCQARSQSHHS